MPPATGTPSRQSTFALPNPDTGLAEWTSKIRAIQRQFDADEEAEQKKLEEEIAAARKARLRRSRGVGYGDSLDLSAKSSGELGSPTSRFEASTPPDAFKSTLDKQSDRDDTLHRLTGLSPSESVDTSSITQGVLPRPSQFPTKPPSQRPEPVSLAAFMGGRATGPRLNRHAPQQDANDPAQFEQRTITAPHPIFGKGGVAMPGMVAKAGGSVRDAVKASEAVEHYQPRLGKQPSAPSLVKPAGEQFRVDSPQRNGSRGWPSGTPPAAKELSEQVEPRSISPQKTGPRERALSTPGFEPAPPSTIDNFGSRPTSTRRKSEVPVVEPRPKTPNRDSVPSTSPKPSAELSFPSQVSTVSSTTSSPSRRSVSTAASLARPIRPEPRTSQAPIIPPSQTPSPAFLKPPPSKDPTPSLSRLQGRGFVQNMVKTSSQLENTAKSVPSPSERSKASSGGRKSSVLDRWQQISPSPSPAPQIPRQASPIRKSYTLGTPAAPDSPASKTPVSPPTGTAVNPKAPIPTLLHPDPLTPPEPLSPRRAKLAEKMLPPEGSNGYGSATTMVVYKPNTPEKASQSIKQPASASSVDELGVRRNGTSGVEGKSRFSVPSELPGSTGKPLNHPTKDRARKPKKNRDASAEMPTPQVRSTPEPMRGTGPSLEGVSFLPRSSEPPRTPSPKPSSESPPTTEEVNTSATADPVTNGGPATKVAQFAQQWGQNAPIGVKPFSSPPFQLSAQTSSSEVQPKTDSNLLRRALPGMTGGGNLQTPPIVTKAKSPSPKSTLQVSDASSRDASPSSTSGYNSSPNNTEGHTKPSGSSKNDKSPVLPSSPKHTRIPSTGNRATVMDVAQALNEYTTALGSEITRIPPEEVKPFVPEPTPEPIIRPRHITAPTLEKRRSSYDRFSVISVMPPLQEETTPNNSPYGTLNRTPDNLSREATFNKQLSPVVVHEQAHHVAKIEVKNDVVHLGVDDGPLPHVDIAALLRSRNPLPLVSPDIHTISVDVLAINGISTSAISRDSDIFYDSELLAIVHRFKSKSSGLVSTQLWEWHGKKNNAGEREERKMQELGKRYNTSPTVISQGSEPPQLVHLLGGRLITRQGNRSHWSADNTTMCSIRKFGDVVYIDEHDVNINNLCSAFSYCLTILDAVYVWHGCGSTDVERKAALQYASRISQNRDSTTELHEGGNDDDELFWMALGDDEFAKADFWKWRTSATVTDPTIWRVDAKATPPVTAATSLRDGGIHSSVYVIDCVWEFFVLVGSQARGDRLSIKLALEVAKNFSKSFAPSRPFNPTVHVLVLPSRLPMDLRLNLRELDEVESNNNDIPDHMNLLSSAQAENHLRQRVWELSALKDPTMLPLGVSGSDA